MNNYTITNFIDEQLRDISNDLREMQFKIQVFSQIQEILNCAYYGTWCHFLFWINASLNDESDNIELQFEAFQEAKELYELCNYYNYYLNTIIFLLENLKKLEKVTREDYAEIMLVKEDGYNMNEYSTYIYRNKKRSNSLYLNIK